MTEREISPRGGHLTPADCLTLSFSGWRARSGPLSWSQRWLWELLANLGPGAHRVKVTLVVPVPDERSVDQVTAALRTLVHRHEALRTTFAPGEDGAPAQQVHGSGSYTIEVRESTDDSEYAEFAQELATEPFDLARELPVRMGLVTRAGAPRAIVLAFAQLALDEWSKQVITEEIRASLTPAPGTAALAPADDIIQPLDHTTLERSPGGATSTAAADVYWREQVGKAESIGSPRRQPRRDRPRYWAARFRSPMVAPACARVARRLEVPPAAVLLSGFCVLLGQHLDQPACVPQLVVSNRYQPASRLTVGRITQQLPITLDLGDGTFAELVECTAREMFRAARHGRFDPVAVGAITPGVGSHDVTNHRFPVVFNFEHRMAGPGGDAVHDVEPRIGSALDWACTAEEGSHGCYFWLPGSGEVTLICWIDTSYLSKADFAGVVFGTERLLVDATNRDIDLKDYVDVAQ